MEKRKMYIATIAKDCAEVARKYGIGLELDHCTMAANMDEEAKTRREIEELQKEAGRPPCFFHGPFNELHPAAIDPKSVELAYFRLEQGYLWAKSLGISHMVVHSGYLPHVYFKKWHIERSVEFWKTFMKGKDSFHIYIENVLEDEPYMMKEMMDLLPEENIHLCLDIGHANVMSKVDSLEWIKTLGRDIGHCHIHNNDGERDLHDFLGRGTIPMEETLRALEEYTKGNTTYTLEVREGKESMEWLRKGGWLT